MSLPLQIILWIIAALLGIGLLTALALFIFFLKVAHTISKTDHGYYRDGETKEKVYYEKKDNSNE